MGEARKFLDMAFDFIVLVLGLAIMISGMSKIFVVQEEQLERTLNGGQSLSYVSDGVEECSGGEVIAFLTGHDFVPVEINGVTYEAHERAKAIEEIEISAKYEIQRQYDNSEFGAPAGLVIRKQ